MMDAMVMMMTTVLQLSRAASQRHSRLLRRQIATATPTEMRRRGLRAHEHTTGQVNTPSCKFIAGFEEDGKLAYRRLLYL